MTHIRKVLGIISGGCIVLLVLAIAFGLWYYLDGKDYLSGKESHYVGTSAISPDDFVILADTKNVLPFYSISQVTRLENGLVEITYDFFSVEDYPFITAMPFSYLDTPLINVLYEARKGFLYLGGFIVLAFFILRFIHKYPTKTRDAENKSMNIAWYIAHPKYLFNRKTAPPIYSAQIKTDVKIHSQTAGIYAVRTWKYKKGYLHSVGVGQARWENKILLADKPLSENNESGIYACRLGMATDDWVFMKHILGIVSLSGEWFEHADGVLRAQSCEIVSLIVSHYHKAVASVLSSTYGVPVVIADNPINTYMNWVFSDNGLSCLKHNAKILKGGSYGNERARNPKREIAVKATGADPGI